MTATSPLFTGLTDQAADGLLALMLAYRADDRPGKLDLGIGVYRDDSGTTPVMAAVKAAERILVDTQPTKVYLGVDGDTGYVQRLAAIPLGAERVRDERLIGMQTPGGTGALRLAAELVAANTAPRRVWIGTPTWPNHVPIFRAAGVAIAEHPFYDPLSQSLDLDGMIAALETASAGEALLLHGCCHNPAGIDFTPDQWERIADVAARRRLIPIVDLAYQGLGRGLEADAYGTRLLFDRCETMLLAYSCDKNFGLYRERTGALWAKAPDAASASRLHVAMRNPARAAWSMPPDHGAAVVRIILESEELTRQWRDELEHMRRRVLGLRERLAGLHPALAGLRSQTGMFAMLPVAHDTVMALRRDHGIYIADDGRLNVAGLTDAAMPRLGAALAPWLGDVRAG
ncbi:MAG: aromatic amino acid aminotransferase [Alphaproteobacteria bacterium HGW-Alphaproteobacteria-6]|jgi:aromatic-amino-acid transaminase|nr:MAG: aromatic amino acid aminotransferase [Alphaproteobacteria bacterium HGW-Alphaproteobacteria-6]